MEEIPFEQLIQKSLELPAEKKIYFNGHVVQSSVTDFVIVLLHNNQPIAHLTTSHIIAKSLGNAIIGVLEAFEKDTQYEIPTLDEMKSRISESKKKP